MRTLDYTWSLQRRINSDSTLLPNQKKILAYSSVTVYCMNFIAFLWVLLKLFSLIVVHLALNPSDATRTASHSCYYRVSLATGSQLPATRQPAGGQATNYCHVDRSMVSVVDHCAPAATSAADATARYGRYPTYGRGWSGVVGGDFSQTLCQLKGITVIKPVMCVMINFGMNWLIDFAVVWSL